MRVCVEEVKNTTKKYALTSSFVAAEVKNVWSALRLVRVSLRDRTPRGLQGVRVFHGFRRIFVKIATI